MFDLAKESAQLAATSNIPWERLEGKTVLITGATGLIGSHCARFLLERNRAFDSNIRVVALVRNEAKAQEMLSGYGEEDGLVICVSDLMDLQCPFEPNFIVHAGCPTASAFFMNHPVETARTIVDGTVNICELARASHSEGVVYVSSMEMYGDGNTQRGLDELLTEDKAGYVNPLSVRSCYPEGKRMAENMCVNYAAEYDVPVTIARLAQTFGPGIPKDDRRVFAMFARCAMQGEDIVLKTTGESTRMYSYTTDAVTALFTIMLKGEPGRAYNIANPATYSSVREMGELVAREFGGGVMQVRIEVDPNAPYPPEHHLPLDMSALMALGWQPQVDLTGMYENLIAYLED